MSDTQITDLFLDESGDFAVGAGGDFFLAEDETSIAADIRHLLLTVPGTAPWDATGEYGVGVQLWLGSSVTRSRLKALSDRIKTALDRDDRLQSGFVAVRFEHYNDIWTIRVSALSRRNNRVNTSVTVPLQEAA